MHSINWYKSANLISDEAFARRGGEEILEDEAWRHVCNDSTGSEVDENFQQHNMYYNLMEILFQQLHC